MTYKKIPKNPQKFECLKCSYVCCNKKDFTKHISTRKHRILTGDLQNTYKKSPKIPLAFECECGKVYKHRQSLNNHKRKCLIKSPITDEIVEFDESHESHEIILRDDSKTGDYKNLLLKSMEQNKELMNLIVAQNQETKELINQNKEMQRTIQDIVPKIGNNNTITTNTTNNNQFNLQVYLNEDCKDAINFSEFIDNMKISFEDLENQSQIGYINGISKLFIENLQELGEHKRPIHCTDKKRKTLYIKENNEWDKTTSQESLKKGIQEVTRRTQQELIKKKEENEEEYSNMNSEFSEKCLSIQHNLIPDSPREITFEKVIENISKKTGIVDGK